MYDEQEIGFLVLEVATRGVRAAVVLRLEWEGAVNRKNKIDLPIHQKT